MSGSSLLQIANVNVRDDAAIARSKMAENALAAYAIPVGDLRNDDGSVIDATGGAGLFNLTSGGFGTGTLTIDGEAATGNTKTDTLMFDFALPAEYVAAGDVKVRWYQQESVGAATDSTTASCEVYKSDQQGGAGSDLLSAFTPTDVTDSWALATADIDESGLLAGRIIRVFIRVVTNDTGGAVGTIAQLDGIQVLCDIKG